MKHTAEDFARAEFARSANGKHKAMRREGVKTDEPWYYLTGNTIHRKDDEQMAHEGWTPVTTEQKGPSYVRLIAGPQDLSSFAAANDLRHDWHEPDERGIGARIIGKRLDNAMGSTARHEHADWGGEFNVVLTRVRYDDEVNEWSQKDLAVVNLVTLLSWAAEHGECQR